MKRELLLAAALSAGLAGVAAGCGSSDKDRTSDHRRVSERNPTSQPVRVQNQMTAREQLEDAEKSEREGKYSHALELYQYLRSYPEASRPKDLEQRIKRVEQKMKEGGQ